jgi:hypothetical protein
MNGKVGIVERPQHGGSICLVSRCAKEAPKPVSSNQASATKVSSLSITSANPATIRICNAAVEIRESCV